MANIKQYTLIFLFLLGLTIGGCASLQNNPPPAASSSYYSNAPAALKDKTGTTQYCSNLFKDFDWEFNKRAYSNGAYYCCELNFDKELKKAEAFPDSNQRIAALQKLRDFLSDEIQTSKTTQSSPASDYLLDPRCYLASEQNPG